jgi:hypothetical protein
MQLTRWLADRHPDVWTTGPTTSFPLRDGIVARVQSVGAVNAVFQTSGAITYVENSYARNAGLPIVNLRNESGAYLPPNAANVTTALRSAATRPDGTQDLAGVYRSADPSAYPLSGYAYAIVPGAGFADTKGKTLGAFLRYAICPGQASLDALGYAPLPPNLVQPALNGIAGIPGAGPSSGCGGSTETVSTEVLPGALIISVEGQEVTLPSPTLTPDARMLVTSGRLRPVRVTDTRAGDPGWTLSGQVSDFASGANRISAANLGWAPSVLAGSPAVVAGPVVEPGAGLSVSRTLASTPAGRGLGTADLDALLSLNVPTTTNAGIYTAVLTLTAI